MISTFLTIVLSCSAIKIENHTKEWNERDQQTLEHAKVRCREMYPNDPCIKLFRKKSYDTYNVICGGEKE